MLPYICSYQLVSDKPFNEAQIHRGLVFNLWDWEYFGKKKLNIQFGGKRRICPVLFLRFNVEVSPTLGHWTFRLPAQALLGLRASLLWCPGFLYFRLCIFYQSFVIANSTFSVGVFCAINIKKRGPKFCPCIIICVWIQLAFDLSGLNS